jgi:hypothetical protein
MAAPEAALRLADGHWGPASAAMRWEYLLPSSLRADLARKVTQDRAALLEMMTALGVAVRQYKAALAWLSEKAARLKLNARLAARSPLSLLEELELMRLGVKEGAAGWRTPHKPAERDQRLDVGQLDDLIDRARSQSEVLPYLPSASARRSTSSSTLPVLGRFRSASRSLSSALVRPS